MLENRINKIIDNMRLEGFTPQAQKYIINNCLDIEYFNEVMDYHNDGKVNRYKNGLDWYKENFSMEELYEAVNIFNLIDIQKVINYCQEIEGRGNIIAVYDGIENIIKIDNIDYYIYRLN